MHEPEDRPDAVESIFERMARRWCRIVEAREPLGDGHGTRVAGYACLLAERIDFAPEQRFWFRMGALLHDVGKAAIPVSILAKPGTLTPAERSIVERHSAAGADIVGRLSWPWDVRPMVRHHHERWDGGGYPDGLAGEEIPLAARILAIADVFDALTSERPYRPAYGARQALAIMAADSGGAFDPVLYAGFSAQIMPMVVAAGPRRTFDSMVDAGDSRLRVIA